MKTKLYIIATPIGNLEDITFRAVRVLSEVDLILCEDTRVTKKLLDKYEIKTPTMSYHQHSKISKIEKIFDLIREGKNLALVSDAGTPTISDPGSFLVSQVRAEFNLNQLDKLIDQSSEVEIIAIPGPSALVSALSVSGLLVDQFLFLGFLPHKKGRETLFKEIVQNNRTSAFYESPHRIIKTLESLKNFFGESSGRKIVIAREITKMFEEVVSGTVDEVINYFEKNPDKIRGEFVVMVQGK